VYDTVIVVVKPYAELSSVRDADSICNTAAFTYNALSLTPGTTYSWTRPVVSGIDNTAGSGSTGTINEHLTNSTTHPVTVSYLFTLSAYGCTNPVYDTVIVVVKPYAELSSVRDADSICNTATFNYTATSATPGTTYSWSRPAVTGISSAAGSGSTGNISEPLTNTTANPVTVSYLFTLSAYGCTNPVYDTVIVVVKPTAEVTQPGNLLICNNTSTAAIHFSGSAVTGTTYHWTNNDASIGLGASGTGDIASFTGINKTASPVTTTILVVPSAYGCEGAGKSFTITVKPTPVVVVPVNQVVCHNTATVLLKFTSAVSGSTFTWTNDNTTIGLAASGAGDIASFTAINTTTAPAVANITVSPEADGCAGSPVSFKITVNASTIIASQPQPKTLCEGGSTSFSVTATGTALTYQWQVNKNDGQGFMNVAGASNSTLNLASVVAAMDGYLYRCVVYGSCVSTVVSNQVLLTVHTAPSITNQPKGIVICEGRGTSFSIESDGTGLQYQWQVDNGSGFVNMPGETDFVLNMPMVTSAMNGRQYRCVVSGACGTAVYSAAASIVVNTAPYITTQPVNQTICEGYNTSFSIVASGSRPTYQWQVDKNDGNGFTNITGATTAGVSINNATASMDGYRYRCLVSGTCTPAATSAIAVLTVPKPLVSTIADQQVCNNENSGVINLTSSIANTVYNWSNNNTGIGLAASGAGNAIPSFKAVNRSVLPVTAEISISSSASGCPGPVSVFKITVNPTPSLNNVVNGDICSGVAFNYTPQSATPAAAFTWSRPAVTGISNAAANGQNNPGEQLVNITTLPVNVTYNYTVKANGCTSSQPVTVMVKPVPVVTISGVSELCAEQLLKLTGTSDVSGVTFTWKDGAGNLLGNTNIYSVSSATVRESRMYELGATKEGCAALPATRQVIVKPLPVVQISGTPALCAGSRLLLSSNSDIGVDQYAWSGPGGLRSNQSQVVIAAATIENAGTYALEAVKNGCSSHPTTYAVQVNAYPKITIQSPIVACASAPLEISANSSLPNSAYLWEAAGLRATTQRLTIPVVTGSSVKCNVAVSKNGCTSYDSVILAVKKSPAVSVQRAADVCQDAEPFRLIAKETTGLRGTGVFSGPSVTTNGQFDPSTAAGTYEVKYTYTTTEGCSDAQAITFKVNPVPKVDAGPDKTMYEGMGTRLEASITGNYKSFTWSIENSTALMKPEIRPMVNPAINTTYKLMATNIYGCQASDEVNVIVLKFRVPSAFSPNGDGINDKWIIDGLNKFKDAQVEIYNRWGTRLFISKGYNEPWDGRYNGALVPTGTYYYIINLNDGTNIKPVGGWIEVMR
jgi:gliding motility-associated-like protein